MNTRSEIDSDKIPIKNVFKMWFRIPEYQHPYVWSNDQINDLLDDITYALTERPDSQYFLGTFVFQKRVAGSRPGQNYDENDLLDGQQRLTTLLLLFAVLRDLATKTVMITRCQQLVYQAGDPYEHQPERIRLTFEHGVRESACNFINIFVKEKGGTLDSKRIEEFVKNNPGPSIANMARAIETIRAFWSSNHAPDMDAFLTFLREYNTCLRFPNRCPG